MFTHNFPPSIGGVQTLVYNVSKRLVERGHDVTVYTSLYPGSRPIEILNGVTVKRFRRRILGVSRPWYITPSMSKIIRSNEVKNVDVIHAVEYVSFQALLATAIKMIRRIPLVSHPQYHRLPRSNKANHIYERILGKHILSSADVLIAQSMYEKKTLPQYIKRRKIVIIPCGINSQKYQDLPDPVIFRRRIGLNANSRIVLYVGSLSGHKRVFDFVNYMPKILNVLDNVKLVIIGKGGWERRIISRIKKLKLEKNIILTGILEGEHLKEAYAASDVLVLPSKHETFGIVLLEAAACGVPIVSTRVGAACELINQGINGILCETEKLEQLSDAVIEVLINERFGKETRRLRDSILKKYDWDNVVQKLEMVYMRLV